MSRNYTRNTRGRPPTFSSAPKLSKTKERPNDNYRQPNSKKSKSVHRNAISNRMAHKRKRVETPSEDDLSSLDGSDTADDASDEDSEGEADEEDDEEELPAVQAPSRSRRLNETGRKSHSVSRDNISIAGSMDSMFGDYDNYYDDDEDPRISPEENRKRFETKIFADSDDENDDVYQGVDDISDSDEEYDDDHIQEQELLAMLSEEDNSEADDLLNQIDGLSAYGFGDDSDASIHRVASSQASDSANEAMTERRVHFAVEGDRALFMRMSESPTITRALLPSALPDHGVSPHVDKRMLGDDLDDSDLTDDCLPEQAHQSPTNSAPLDKEMSPSVSPPFKKPSKKSPRRRGPPRGIFIDDGDKPSGILDPSGKIILMTNPHLLGEEFARRYGASQTSSPDVGFAELIEDSDSGEQLADLMNAPNADIMLASLNSAMNDPSNLGQAIGPLEAFYPSNSILIGDYAVDPDDLEENFRPDEDLGEDVINLEDVIQFDDDTDDSDAPTSPIYMPPSRELSGLGGVGHELAHLNNNNVTAFRRNADPAFAAFSNTPSFHDMELFSSPFATPAPRRKRKHHSSPYTSSHYKGVTPVQRMRDPKQAHTPDPTTPAKRRRLMI